MAKTRLCLAKCRLTYRHGDENTSRDVKIKWRKIKKYAWPNDSSSSKVHSPNQIKIFFTYRNLLTTELVLLRITSRGDSQSSVEIEGGT